ncbi:MAG: hypothetical protein HKN25_07935 [Pyrinomonadaceae bacterium]|nr:hypothetical protein [Pyrinomonadaceae bacterium]
MEILPIKRKKIDALLKQCRHLNIFPFHLEQYYPKTEPHPVADILEDLMPDVIDQLHEMSDEKIRTFVESLPAETKYLIDLRTNESTDDTKLERIAFKYIVALIQREYISFKKIVSADLNESEVLKIYPEIAELLDKDGLLNIDQRFQMFDGGIKYKHHFFHYHQFLRRGYVSNPNFDFLGRFIRYYLESNKTNTFRVAIDHTRIMPKEFFAHMFERGGWFGPPFNREKLDDPREIGLFVVERRRPSLFDADGKLDRTEFLWSFRNGIKTFQIEEISNSEYFHDPYYINRFVHSERDTADQNLRHFDGAVKIYLNNHYEDRISSRITDSARSFKKIKLFRLDGEINLDRWIDLIAMFFRGNEMIIEYFDPDLFEETFGNKIRQYQESLG